jgi:hypothetical protein
MGERNMARRVFCSTKFSKQGNQRTTKEKENIPDLISNPVKIIKEKKIL